MTDLTTLAAVKAFAGITTTNDDNLIEGLITAYSKAVRSFTNRDFFIADYEIWRSGRDSTFLLTPQYPIASVSLVQVDGVTIPAATTFGSYGYRFTTDRIVLSGGATFTAGESNIFVQYSAGYATVPADVAEAVTEIVALRYKMKGDNLHWTSKSLAGETVTLNTKDMPASAALVLKQYINNVPL